MRIQEAFWTRLLKGKKVQKHAPAGYDGKLIYKEIH